MLIEEDGHVEVTEKELGEEGRKLGILQESLQQTAQLCSDMIKQLDEFEARVAALEPTLMPLHRNLGIISRETANGLAIDSLAQKYREWLTSASVVIDPTQLDTDEMDILPELATGLKKIAEYSLHSDLRSDIMGCYGEVRSNYMLQTLQILFRNIDTTIKGTYTRGTHPFIMAVREFFRMAQREKQFAAQVLSTDSVVDAVRRAISHPADLVKMSAETVSTRVHKASAKHEFVDQIWLFDVIEAFNDIYVECPDLDIKETVQPALVSVTTTGVDFLKELMDYVQDTSRNISTLTAAANATVFEQTSAVLNCLKKMLEYERIIEVVLSSWSHKQWDYIVGPISTDAQNFATALYYQDLLKGLEAVIEKYSHGYKRPMVSVLFQLNNYNHILRSCAPLSHILVDGEGKYAEIVNSLQNEYVGYWQHTAALLDDGAQRAAGSPPKDRLKQFSTELEEHVKSQEGCAVPDAELRMTLIEKVQHKVTTVFIPFYNLYPINVMFNL